jgi:sugar lactone lactonase YvrE
MVASIPHGAARWLAAAWLAGAIGTAVAEPPGSGIAVDGEGAIYFTDTAHGPWKIQPSGRVARREGPAFRFLALDAGGRFAGTSLPPESTADLRHAGEKPTLILSRNVPIAIGRDGALYFPQPGADGRLRMLRLLPSGTHSVLATLPATSEEGPLENLNGIAAGGDGAIYYTENRAIRRISPEGTLSTVATSINVPDCVPPGHADRPAARLGGLAVTADGTIFAAASGCGALVRVSPQGDVQTVLRSVAPWSPTAVAVAGQDVLVLEYPQEAGVGSASGSPRVRKLSGDGRVSLLAEVRRR